MFFRAQTIEIVLCLPLAMIPIFGGPGNVSRSIQRHGIPSDLSITLERTRCYGFCPSYVLTISASGAVAYEGRAHVKVMGNAKSVIPKEKLRRLIGAFEKIDFFALRGSYETPEDGCKDWAADGPTAITTLKINGRAKTVRHYYGCRGFAELVELEKLEQSIDDAANAAQWIR